MAENETPVTDELLDLLHRYAESGEAHGALAPQSVDALKQSRLLRAWQPCSLGGLEWSPAQYARAAETVAGADSAAAWLMMVAANTTFDLRRAETALVEEIFADQPDAIVGETFNRPFAATPESGGYRVTGASALASGCVHADWLGHTAVCEDGFLLMFHPRGALSIADDWHALGMRASASNTISADDVYVPAHRVIRLDQPLRTNRYFEGVLYRMPEAIITATFPPVALGILKAALDALSALAVHKVPFASQSPLRERALAQHGFGRCLAAYRSAAAFYHATLDDAYARAQSGVAFTLPQRADLFLACAHTLQTCAETLPLLVRAAGSSAVYQGSVIERALRDTQVIAQHAFGADARFASVAQAYWDVQIDFPLMAMD